MKILVKSGLRGGRSGGVPVAWDTALRLALSTYRDARINRIFEGTNEINRMLTVDMI